MPKKERYQINMRVRKEFRDEVTSLAKNLDKTIVEMFIEGIRLFKDKHKIKK